MRSTGMDLPDSDIWAEGGAPCRGIEEEFGIPRTRQFELFRANELVSVLIGKRRIVARRSAREYLRRLHRAQENA